MADLIVQYQRVGAITPRWWKAGRMLAVTAVGLLVFAAIIGWDAVDAFVVQRVWGPWSVEGAVWTRRVVHVYHWDKLVYVAVVMAGPLALAGAYWFLGRAIGRRRDRTLVIAALTLAIVHTLAAALCVLWFVLVGASNLQFAKWSVTMGLQVAGSALVVAMVPGMMYVSVTLMDLLGEKVVVRRGAEEPAKGLVPPPSPPS